jgi:hypothetical protein
MIAKFKQFLELLFVNDCLKNTSNGLIRVKLLVKHALNLYC